MDNFAIDVIMYRMLEFFNYSNIKDNNPIKAGLEFFKGFPGFHSCAVFLLNDDTFEFELKFSIPDNNQTFHKVIYNKLVSEGVVGNTIQTGTFNTYNDKETKNNFILYPLMTLSNINGLVLVVSESDFTDTKISLLRAYLLFSRLYAFVIENQDLEVKESRSKEILNQLIASRTIELTENNRKLGDKIEKLKHNLSMSIPHEVRTPINHILGYSDYLINYFSDKITDDKQDLIDILYDIKISGNRLRNLFENFIYYTQLSLISTSIKDIQELQKKVSPYCDALIYEQIEIKAHNYGRKDDVICNLVSANLSISEEYLSKLVLEVIDNALKYSKPGEKVNINSNIVGNMYCLIIKDNGQGFNINNIDEIDAYLQFDRNKQEQQGLGLGLSIIQKITSLHNGILDIKSKINEFTEVSIELPIAKDYAFKE